nr:hypothetical protein [Tanacetum cinerariifolium]
MGLSPFIHFAYPTKVTVAERERVEGEARLLNFIVGRVVSLLPVAPTRAKSELEASVDRLFDEGGSADQEDSAACSGQDAETELVIRVKIIAAENVIAERPKRPRKKRQAVTNASGSSHPPKKLSILNVEAGVEAVATLPLVTSSVSATPEHESGAPVDSITRLNLRTIGQSKRVNWNRSETEAAKSTCLRAQVSAIEATDKIIADEIDALKQRNVSLENEKDSLDGKDGLSAGIDHEKARRSLMDIVAYNPAAEAGYNSALQRLREVDFPLLAELNSHKDTSTVEIMNLICLEGPLADAHGISDLQPEVEQLTLRIHRPEDQVVLGETSLSFALSVSHSRVKKIKENVAAQRSTLIDVWIPLVDPLSAKNLTGAASTSGSVPDADVATTALSTTFASTSSVPPITTDDYDIVNVDGQEDVRGDVASFPTVDFEKEELDTTPERDPPS